MEKESKYIPEGYKLEVKIHTNCVLCMNPQLKEYDSVIWSRRFNWNQISTDMAESGFNIETDEIQNHSMHLVLVPLIEENILSDPVKIVQDEMDSLKVDELRAEKEISTMQTVNSSIMKISSKLIDMEGKGLMDSGEYNALLRQLKEWVELKNKLTGELVDRVEVNPAKELLDELIRRREEKKQKELEELK